jgi:putative transposase
LIVTFVDQHKEEYGVEPICEQLTELGCKFAPWTYYEAFGRQPSKRAVRDETLKEVIAGEYRKNYSVYGPRKMWMHLRRKNHLVARCTVERLMGILALQGARRGKAKRTTIGDPRAVRAQDLVKRDFAPLAPNRRRKRCLTCGFPGSVFGGALVVE